MPRHIVGSIGAAAVAAWAIPIASISAAQAEPCPDAEQDHSEVERDHKDIEQNLATGWGVGPALS